MTFPLERLKEWTGRLRDCPDLHCGSCHSEQADGYEGGGCGETHRIRGRVIFCGCCGIAAVIHDRWGIGFEYRP